MSVPTAPDGQVTAWAYHFTDMRSGRYLTALPLVAPSFTDVRSGVGAGEGILPLASEEVRARDPWAATVPRKTVCWAERIILDPSTARPASSTLMWAGPVITRKRSRSGRTMTLGMVSWAGWFARRLVAVDHTFTAADDFAILRWLFEQALDQPGGDSAHLYVGDEVAGTLSDRTYEAASLKPVLEAAEQFATSEGIDWRFELERDTEGLLIARLAMGRPLGRTDAPDLVWSSNADATAAGHLLDYDILEDGSGVNNHLVALGDGSGPTQLRADVYAADVGRDEDLYGYPLWESSLSSSTSDLTTQASVDRHALGAMAEGLAGEFLMSSALVRGDLAPTCDTYAPGDVGVFRLEDDYSPEAEREIRARILGRKITPAQPGSTERITMTLEALP